MELMTCSSEPGHVFWVQTEGNEDAGANSPEEAVH